MEGPTVVRRCLWAYANFNRGVTSPCRLRMKTCDTGARVSPSSRCRLAADRMPFADDVTAVDSSATWRSSIQDGGVTSPTSRVAPAAKLWSLPDVRRAKVVNALKGETERR